MNYNMFIRFYFHRFIYTVLKKIIHFSLTEESNLDLDYRVTKML